MIVCCPHPDHAHNREGRCEIRCCPCRKHVLARHQKGEVASDMRGPIDDRQHASAQSTNCGRKPHAEYWTAKTAAKRLGVAPELVEGLVKTKKLDGYVDTGRSGKPVVMVEIDFFFLMALDGYSLG